jgi:hypothetical protein
MYDQCDHRTVLQGMNFRCSDISRLSMSGSQRVEHSMLYIMHFQDAYVSCADYQIEKGSGAIKETFFRPAERWQSACMYVHIHTKKLN